MAHHNNTPESVLKAPKPLYAYVEDKDGNPIKFEGSNRRMLRQNGIGVAGFSKSSMSARRKPQHPFVSERLAKRYVAASAAVAEKRENIAKRWWKRHKKDNTE